LTHPWRVDIEKEAFTSVKETTTSTNGLQFHEN